MTQKQEYLKRGLLAKIHIHPQCKQRKELEVWEEFLFGSYGERSSANLSIDELYNLIDVLDGRTEPRISGVRPRKKAKAKTPDPNAPLSEKQELYLRRLWNIEPDRRGMCPVTKELLDFAFRTLGFHLLYLHNLTSTQANKLITGTEYLRGIKKHKSSGSEG
jgi:hypothetical protein